MKSGSIFFNRYHIDMVKDVIENAVDGATMFSADSIQMNIYYKYENGKLMHTGTVSKRHWFDTGYSTVAHANANGVRDIYDLKELEKIYANYCNERACKSS